MTKFTRKNKSGSRTLVLDTIAQGGTHQLRAAQTCHLCADARKQTCHLRAEATKIYASKTENLRAKKAPKKPGTLPERWHDIAFAPKPCESFEAGKASHRLQEDSKQLKDKLISTTAASLICL